MPVMFNETLLMTAALCLGTFILLATAGPLIRDALRKGKAVTGIGTFDRKKNALQYWLALFVPSAIIVLMAAATIVNILRYKSPF